MSLHYISLISLKGAEAEEEKEGVQEVLVSVPLGKRSLKFAAKSGSSGKAHTQPSKASPSASMVKPNPSPSSSAVNQGTLEPQGDLNPQPLLNIKEEDLTDVEDHHSDGDDDTDTELSLKYPGNFRRRKLIF